MIFKEEKRDLFTVPQGYYLVHCISGDYTLGAGIAKQFVEVYNMRFKLHKNFPLPDGERSAHVGEALLIDNVFNLVTKDISNVSVGEIAPAFEQVGGGIQYEMPDTISNLMKHGFIKEIP